MLLVANKPIMLSVVMLNVVMPGVVAPKSLLLHNAEPSKPCRPYVRVTRLGDFSPIGQLLDDHFDFLKMK